MRAQITDIEQQSDMVCYRTKRDLLKYAGA